MRDIIINNLGTILVGTFLIILVGIVIVKMFRDKKNRKTSCGCSCQGCPGRCDGNIQVPDFSYD